MYGDQRQESGSFVHVCDGLCVQNKEAYLACNTGEMPEKSATLADLSPNEVGER
ncbi:hypothetical protein GCM10007086_38890 [Photobacterium aphoticum]|nr:hypothetical protein GCM10007086_38890 [Photobacterium aphoticum]